jgi:uncharacterized protein YijF (DUF1287 family)
MEGDEMTAPSPLEQAAEKMAEALDEISAYVYHEHPGGEFREDCAVCRAIMNSETALADFQKLVGEDRK